MEQNVFLQEYFKFVEHLYQLKNILNILVTLLGLIRGNLTKYQQKTLKCQKITAIYHPAISKRFLFIIMYHQTYILIDSV